MLGVKVESQSVTNNLRDNLSANNTSSQGPNFDSSLVNSDVLIIPQPNENLEDDPIERVDENYSSDS